MQIIKMNTIKARGLPTTVSEHRMMERVLPELLACMGDVEVYRGKHAAALDTICWFAYGEKPKGENSGG